MKSNSSEAYDLAERVRTYDADMDIMHPLRHKMIDVALSVLPFDLSSPLTALDLGVGTGVFTKRFLEHFGNARVVALDGAEAMLALARIRLGDHSSRVQWEMSDFQRIPSTLLQPNTYDVVISSFALHHLTPSEKLTLLKSVVAAINPGGWLLNADLVVAKNSRVETRIQQIRVQAVTRRAPSNDTRFCDFESTRSFLDDLEAADHDQPLTLEADLQIIRESGIESAEVLWKEFREAVIGGPK